MRAGTEPGPYGWPSVSPSRGFAPFGKVISGMKTVDMLHDKYGEGAPKGLGPDQARIRTEGTAYLLTEFPALDFIKTATIIEKP